MRRIVASAVPSSLGQCRAGAGKLVHLNRAAFILMRGVEEILSVVSSRREAVVHQIVDELAGMAFGLGAHLLNRRRHHAERIVLEIFAIDLETVHESLIDDLPTVGAEFLEGNLVLVEFHGRDGAQPFVPLGLSLRWNRGHERLVIRLRHFECAIEDCGEADLRFG